MKINRLSDQELIDLYLDGDELGIETLINRYKDYVLKFILNRIWIRQVAEDIFQDTFIKVIHSLRAESYTDQGRFLAWVYKIAHNLICDYWRKSNRMPIARRRSEVDILDTIKIYDDSFEEIIVKEQISNDVQNLIELLTPEQREVVMMKHYSGMTFDEIAEETNVNINTLCGRMRYALNTLRKLIKEKELKLTY